LFPKPGSVPRVFLLILQVTGALSLAGCGYHVVGRTNQLPGSIQTIAVPSLVNRTSTYRIEQRLTEAVVREFLTRTKYRVVASPEAADATIRGQVDGIDSGAVVFDPATGRATTVLVTLRLRVRLEDRTGKVLYRNDNFQFRQAYEISTDVATFFQEEGPTLDRMARDFADRLVSDILENY
jgi:outer membrane lipopolysaccharide assembly protein LptE/RlpB